MNHKLQQVTNIIKKNNADSMIVIDFDSFSWFTGCYLDFCLILVHKNKAHVLVDPRDYGNTKKEVSYANILLYKNPSDWFNLVKKLKPNKCLYAPDKMSIAAFNKWIRPLNIPKLISFQGDDLRIVKDATELKKMQIAADIAVDGVNHIKHFLKVGMTEKQAATEFLKFIINKGAASYSFPTIISFGENSANPHATPTNRKLKKGEFILMDCGVIYEGYCSDITRVWWIGKPTEHMVKMYNTVLAANKIGITNAKAGIIGNKLDKITRDYIKNKWNNYDIPHGVGHGLGTLIHENPRVNKVYNKPLPVNSVVTIEPGIYEENLGGVRIEDSIVIAKTGCKVLTAKAVK